MSGLTLARSTFRALLAPAVLLLWGCGGGGGSSIAPEPPAPPAAAPTGLLIPADSDSTLLEAVQGALPRSLTSTGDTVGELPEEALAPPSLDAGDAGFSTTYRLEAAVDEHDIVKYDGARMVVAPSRSACCFLLEPAADAALPAPLPDTARRQIRILDTDPSSAQAVTVGAVELQDDETIEGLYLEDEQLVTLSSTAWWGAYGDSFATILPWAAQNTAVSIYDIANPGAPSRIWRLDVEGALVASRRVDNQLLLISRHFPSIEGLNLFPAGEEDVAANLAALEDLSVEELLPGVRIDGEGAEDVLGVADCLVTDPEHPKASQRPGSAVLTTLLSIDLTTRQVIDARCYTDPAEGIYVTASSIYLAHGASNEDAGTDTLVHRFSHGQSITYRGSGRVPGVLLGRGQADFRMSEQEDRLRLVTTRFTGDEDDLFDHRLLVLEQDAQLPELRELARLPNASRPEELGKANEDLYGVRFLGDRAYLVTFERIDPLYVLDLADAGDPRILGEVELPGFSDLLHPVSDDLLLGLGDDGEGAVKVELFDVSAPTAPRSRAAVTLAQDASWSWSEARYDRRAFTYLPGATTDRFTVPVSGGVEDEDGFRSLQRLYLLEVRGTDDAPSATLGSVGVLSLDDQPGRDARYRSFIDGDAVYFLAGDVLWSTFWSDPAQRFGPF